MQVLIEEIAHSLDFSVVYCPVSYFCVRVGPIAGIYITHSHFNPFAIAK